MTFLSVVIFLCASGCRESQDEKLASMGANKEAVENSPEKDLEIQKYNQGKDLLAILYLLWNMF